MRVEKKEKKSKTMCVCVFDQCHREGCVGSQAEIERRRMGEVEGQGTDRRHGEKEKAK